MRTAIVVLLPGAEPLLDLARQVDPPLVRPLPAHVSLLYPGPGVLREVPLFDVPAEVELREVRTGDDGFVGVAVPALDAVAARFRAAFPGARPYGGRYGDAPPAHLTVALGATPVQAERIASLVRSSLPRRSEVRGPYLLRNSGSGWRPV